MAVTLIENLISGELEKEIKRIESLLSGQVEIDYDEDSEAVGRIVPENGRYFTQLFEWEDFNEFFSKLGYKTTRVSWHFFSEKIVDNCRLEFESKDGRCSFKVYES